MRLATGNPEAARLFEAAGFERRLDCRWWRAQRVEGGDPSRMPDPSEATRLWAAVEKSPGIELYRGVTADFNGAYDLGAAELERLASIECSELVLEVEHRRAARPLG